MKQEFMDSYVKLFKKVLLGKGADIVFGNQHFKGKLNYIILEGRSIHTGKYYSGLFPFSESEFFYLNEVEQDSQVLIGDESEDNSLVTTLLNNVKVFKSHNEFLKDKFTPSFVNTFENNLSILQKRFIDDLVGHVTGAFNVMSASITLVPTRCITLTYSVEGVVAGKLVLLLSSKNTIRNKYTGSYFYDFKEMIESIGVPVEWEALDEESNSTTYVYEQT